MLFKVIHVWFFRLSREWTNVSSRKVPLSRFYLTSSLWSQTANRSSRGPASSAVPGTMVKGSYQSGSVQWWSLIVLMLYLCSFTGLQISRFCLCSEDKLVESLLQNQVHLFLTTDPNEVQQASHKGEKVSSVAYYICLWRWEQAGSHDFWHVFAIHNFSHLFRGCVSAPGSGTSCLPLRSAQSYDQWRCHHSAQQWTAASSG